MLYRQVRANKSCHSIGRARLGSMDSISTEKRAGVQRNSTSELPEPGRHIGANPVSLKGIEVLVSPDSNPQPGAPLPPSAPRNEEAIRMREILASQEGKLAYALRKSTVEPVFGQIKEARGIRRFRLRGLFKVTSEWRLISATHNLLKLFRHRTAVASA